MRYFKTWKEAGAVPVEITKDQAVYSLERCYNPAGIEEMLSHEQVIPCMTCTIEVREA